MLILGIDPGTATTGFGIIEVSDDGYEALEWGLIETEKNGSPEKRLQAIYEQMVGVIEKHNPDVLVIESVFFATNAKTAIKVGQAQGVILMAAAKTKTNVAEYAPGTIKKMISGNGRADKKMMQQAVRKHLGGRVRSKKRKKTHFDNEADALAVALCHAFHCEGC